MTIHSITNRLRILPCAITILAAASTACQSANFTAPDGLTSSASAGGTNAAPAGTQAAINAELAQLRAVTAHFHDLDDAMAAGYAVQVTPCLELPGVGGMGFHYGNPAFIGNPVQNPLEPELLLFEPQKNGDLRFVGVEYIIPFEVLPPTAPAPILFGRPMHAAEELGIWALHVWVGRHNPLGMFEDWNPMVSCEFAS